MKLSNQAIELVNSHLGFSGQPYKILFGSWQDTPCYSWVFPSEVLDSPEFEKMDVRDRSLVHIEELRKFNLDPILDELSSKLASFSAIPYKSLDLGLSLYESLSRTLVVAPFSDQYDIFRLEEGLFFSPIVKSSACEKAIDFLKSIATLYGLTIVGAAGSAIEFKLDHIPIGADSVELSERLIAVAPDIYGDWMDFEDVIDFSRSNGQITLWWDDLVYSMDNYNAG